MASLVIQKMTEDTIRSVSGKAYDWSSDVVDGVKVTTPVAAAVVYGPVATRGLVYIISLFGQVLVRRVTGTPPSPSVTIANAKWIGLDGSHVFELEAGESIAALAVSYT